MKTRSQHCSLSVALQQADRLGAHSTSSAGPGSVRKWDNGREELVFVPDDAYSKSGTLTIRNKVRNANA